MGQRCVTVNATIPVMASFSNDGRTVTISPHPRLRLRQRARPAASNCARSRNLSATAPPTSCHSQPPVPSVTSRLRADILRSSTPAMVATITEKLSATRWLEKDVTVALARSLRQELESRGITTLVLRDSDANLSVDQRAVFANADHAAIYIALHAASSGHGVRVYTALLPFGR